MSRCMICNSVVFDGLYLTNGKVIHKSCLKSIQEKESDIRSTIDILEIKLNELKKEKRKSEGFFFKAISIFSKPTIEVDKLEANILSTEKNIEKLSDDLAATQSILVPLYDYFPTYPPDWYNRRIEVAARDGNQCYKCGRNRELHLHHIKALSKGGSNKTYNLRLLCEDCHSQKHGGREFNQNISNVKRTDEHNSETTFSKRIKNIEQAIRKGKRIKFSYKKPTDKGYKQRIVNPYELVDLKHQRNIGSTLCVRGYCELRKAKRTFALKRMRGLKIIDTETDKIAIKPKRKAKSKSQYKTKKSATIKRKKPNKNFRKKNQLEDMYDQLDQHDIENLKLMGYDTEKK